ncbi:N-formylglutamate deformylase [Thalassomonas sp. M1454]|uniref:N-formylglutamate deformylase n=1 Tax=Thalassomonas sp. M1454 TaxID=2594477 RepID=UPI00117C6EBA|nr:N-formylglutamate deformylase [Thalassomonas sp. M1454]TRX58011.1 N-formylglutamate deformylase [Thalassomonas sp. M1454]
MSNSTYTLIQGKIPLLISMPHNGEAIPDDIKAKMTPVGLSVQDTDWYMDKLYAFAIDLGAYILMPKYSRYVIDLNRDPTGINLYPGSDTTELCPTTSFESKPLYLPEQSPDVAENERRVKLYWQPYHQAIQATLDKLQQEFGKAVMLEAHSIASVVPRFFDGQLPDFNFGTNNGVSCDEALVTAIEALDYSPYSQVTNGRFKGGYITRAYADIGRNIHTLQLELSQRTYMNEDTLEYADEKAEQVIPKLQNLVNTMADFAQS